MTKQLLLILTVVVWTLPSWAVKTPSEGSSAQDLTIFGVEADPEVVLAFARQDQSNCSPSCRRLTLRYFHNNPQATAEQVAEALELWATLGEMDNKVLLNLTPTVFAEAPRFHDFLAHRTEELAAAYLRENVEIRGDRMPDTLANIPLLLVSVEAKDRIQLLERIVQFTPENLEVELYKKFSQSPLYHQINNPDDFVARFEEPSPILYEFLNRMSWWETYITQQEQFARGFAMKLGRFARTVRAVLTIGSENQVTTVLTDLGKMASSVGSPAAHARGTQNFLSANDVAEGLVLVSKRLPNIQNPATRLKARIQWLIENARDLEAAAHQENESCGKALVELMTKSRE